MSHPVHRAARGEADALAELNGLLEPMSAERRVAWALDNLPGAHILTSSFGAQAAVSLHLVTRKSPRLPVILLDTGYLFPETYAFIETLTERLSLNLKVYRSTLSPAWMEARFGKLWEQGVAGLEKYNDLTKLEPMRGACARRVPKAGSRACGALRRAVAATSGRSSGGRAPSASIRSWTGPTGMSGPISASMTCRTTQCGTGATCRLVTGTRRARCTRPVTSKPPASSASSASAGCTG